MLSKNYNNTIPIFMPEKQLRKRCMQIVTDSKEVAEPKDPKNCNIFQLLSYFLTVDQSQDLAKRYHAGGLGYGVVKQELYETLLNYFKAARDRYQTLINDPVQIQDYLDQGQYKARQVAGVTLSKLKQALGI